MSPLIRDEANQTYWRSLEQLAATPEYLELAGKEFPAGDEQSWTESSRRRFLQLVGASVALAGASSCYWQKETIAPFRDRPEGRVPGVARHFATSMELGGWGAGLLVTSYDGRPTKVEGNPDHPSSAGATDVYAQAATLELYDPDRSRQVGRLEGEALRSASWRAFDDWAENRFTEMAVGGAELAAGAPGTRSPGLARPPGNVAPAVPSAPRSCRAPGGPGDDDPGVVGALGPGLPAPAPL
ncbi:MAG: TAT-variant-translocated molybdopterin oxidoreductase, partial [Planctomycetes bacterium]|nr:TAT-variant-translocated molybdopterin oxidoreductase [Planctomycetota bacterium]